MSADDDFFRRANDLENLGDVPPPPFRHSWLVGPLVWIFVVGNLLVLFGLLGEYVDDDVTLPLPLRLFAIFAATIAIVRATRARRRHTPAGLRTVALAVVVTALVPSGRYNYNRTGDDEPFLSLPPFGIWNIDLVTRPPPPTPTYRSPAFVRPEPPPPPPPPVPQLGALSGYSSGGRDCVDEIRDGAYVVWLVGKGGGCDWRANIDGRERCGHERRGRIVFDDVDVVVRLRRLSRVAAVGNPFGTSTMQAASLRIERPGHKTTAADDLMITRSCQTR